MVRQIPKKRPQIQLFLFLFFVERRRGAGTAAQPHAHVLNIPGSVHGCPKHTSSLPGVHPVQR